LHTHVQTDTTTHTVNLPANASVTPAQVIAAYKSLGGFWAGGEYTPGSIDVTGVAAGSVWVAWEQIVSVTIS
jgi:hypothetical protein